MQDGDTANGAWRLGAHELVLLDIGLPGRDGFDLPQRMRSSGSRVPVIILTARDGVQDRIDGVRGC